MFGLVPTKRRSNSSRRRRAVEPALPGQAPAAKRQAESSTSASSCFHSEILSTSATNLAAQRHAKRPRHPEAEDADSTVSDCSEVVGGAKAHAAGIEASESSCLGSVLGSDLACPEKLSEEDEGSEYSSAREELTPSDFERELFGGLCAIDSSAECSFSPLIVSPSSEDEAAGPVSPTFSLFLALAEQFVPCTHPEAHAVADAALLPGKQFDELDDEESYEQFRRRERHEAVTRDYCDVYCSMPGGLGRLVIGQRLHMVNWIIEHSHVMKLQPETMFMGIGLMDRFLTRGYFENARSLQLLSIACITLATRIEENQPYNSILQRTFKVGINVYSRSEVVAMEWLVQEVLNFQCFVTTTHHFLWFYLKAAKADENVADLSKYLALLSLLDNQQLSFWPSTVAAAVVVLVCLATNNKSSCHSVMETHMRTKDDDLPECIKSLEWLIKYASEELGPRTLK